MAVISRIKDLVRRRARNRCEYCMCPEQFATQPLSIEHIQPRSKNGSDDEQNLALCCQASNNHKFTKTEAFDVLSGETVPLFHPRQMIWEDHFAWSVDYTEIIALSPVGRVTIQELQLNRSGVRNLRRVLVETGEHPRD